MVFIAMKSNPLVRWFFFQTAESKIQGAKIRKILTKKFDSIFSSIYH